MCAYEHVEWVGVAVTSGVLEGFEKKINQDDVLQHFNLRVPQKEIRRGYRNIELCSINQNSTKENTILSFLVLLKI